MMQVYIFHNQAIRQKQVIAMATKISTTSHSNPKKEITRLLFESTHRCRWQVLKVQNGQFRNSYKISIISSPQISYLSSSRTLCSVTTVATCPTQPNYNIQQDSAVIGLNTTSTAIRFATYNCNSVTPALNMHSKSLTRFHHHWVQHCSANYRHARKPVEGSFSSSEKRSGCYRNTKETDLKAG